MKLASAIEDFIQYKQALGNLYIGSANILKAFVRKTGNLELEAITSAHCQAFLPVKSGTVTAFGSRSTPHSTVFSATQPSADIYSIEFSPLPCQNARRASFLTLFDRRHPSLTGRA